MPTLDGASVHYSAEGMAMTAFERENTIVWVEDTVEDEPEDTVEDEPEDIEAE
jgi:hypothetical protein